ncbi:MAG: hypothetical protein KDH96_10040 [Candidatus Riesia sp.]|nr:hypothetical protein [Candidatus Riesia sp.]
MTIISDVDEVLNYIEEMISEVDKLKESNPYLFKDITDNDLDYFNEIFNECKEFMPGQRDAFIEISNKIKNHIYENEDQLHEMISELYAIDNTCEQLYYNMIGIMNEYENIVNNSNVITSF